MATYILRKSDVNMNKFIMGDYSDVSHYCDKTKLRRDFGLTGRGRILSIWAANVNNPEFINEPNKAIKYKSSVCVSSICKDAIKEIGPNGMTFHLTKHPYGDVVVILKE